MQPVNIERGLAAIEAKLQDRKCLPHLLALAREHPEDINKYLSLAESIDSDLSARSTTVKVTEEREKYIAFFVLPSITGMVPKGKYLVAFCDSCFYLDSPSRQIKIEYNNIRNVISIGALDVKEVMNVVISLKTPLEIGKRHFDSLCLSLDNHTSKKIFFEDKKRQISGKAYSIFLTVLKLKFPFTLIKPELTFFISSQRTAFIKCYHGTSPCYLIPFRSGLVVLTSTIVHYLPNESITALNLDRLGGNTFDFTVKAGKRVIDVCMLGNYNRQLTMVSREERMCLEEYSKEIIHENRRKQNGIVMSEEESSEEEFSEESEDEGERERDAAALKELVKEEPNEELSGVGDSSDEQTDEMSESRRKRVSVS
ncbi:hypothetical protein WA171_004472 [Blastocystis sp. BT1]